VTGAQPKTIAWYRTPLSREVQQSLHQRSDLLGWLQTLGYLGVITATGATAYYSAGHWPWPVTLALLFLHGTCFAFQINAVHELGHATVFRTRRLNRIFEQLFAFLGWINCEKFRVSHAEHHRFTLHPPDDLEVLLPQTCSLKGFLQFSFVNAQGAWGTLKEQARLARGRFTTAWEQTIFPADDMAKRARTVRWARTLFVGHGLIVAVSLAMGWWMLPVVVTLAPFYGGWLFYLCNNTQHIGLQDNVSDFRLCCRTFTLNPVAQFLYWHMNYHTEHHMYAAVPCYRLGRLHRLIRHDLPPCPRGLAATWREIAAILAQQRQDPAYQHVQPLPQASAG
jgi:fatty acid desaturase